MEHVEGRPIHRACDEERLGIEERLRLFEVVAAAVHHAHQNLVVHRDLKPSNILVTSAGEVKLLDFGIAKLLDLTSEESLEMTRTGALPVTPLYASPEQLLGEAVTTASDVYQLGLLLFELLTGEAARRSSATPAAARLAPEVVPSQAVESLPDERRAEVAAARSTTPRGLVRTLRPELDAVVRAALRPEPSGRYASAAELADDVRRVRRHEPLSVRPATVRYRAGRFLRRNRLGVALGALFVLLLVAYSVVVTLQAQRIARERDRSERIQAFALGLYGAGDPNEALGPEVSAVQLVDRGVERAQAELADESDVQAEVLGFFANVYVRLGRYDEAESLYRQVLALRRSLHGPEHPEVATALDDLARLLLERDDPEALVHIEEALAQRRRLLGPDHTDTARSLVNLGRYRRSVRELDAAEEALRTALEIYCAEDPPGADCADTLAELGWVANLQDRPDEADRLLRRNFEINRALYGEVHPEVATAWNNLGNTLWRLDRWQEGDEAMARSMEVMRQLYGASHPDIATSLGNLAHSLQRRGEFERAIDLFGQSRDMRIELLGPRHVRVAEATAQLAEALRDAGRHDEAVPRFEEALSIFGEHLPPDHPSFARVYRGLGALQLATGELAEARRALEAARRIYAGPAGSLWPWRVDVLLAEVDRRQGDPRAAAARLDEAEEHLATDKEWLERLAAERALLRQQPSED